MARDTEKRRLELRETLTDIAERHVREEGTASLRARALANEAGCAVGAIYNVFEDMTGLILSVNGRTFQRMGEYVLKSAADKAPQKPADQLVTIAHAYLNFASENPNLWRALFDVEMPSDREVPAWYLDELGKLFSIIASPLSELNPTADAREIDLLTRALFSSVHGIVLLGLEQRISGVPSEQLEEMIEIVLRNFAASQART
ncbi:MAG: TetR/AcrR family transcriptional regulator [Boseongicola sp.]|nr:TetR/AcrR family transcriptional regulator [Boseongicola sp.]